MTTPVTEICYLTLKEGISADIEDGETGAGKVLRDSLRMASEQKGFQRWYVGKQCMFFLLILLWLFPRILIRVTSILE